MTELVIENVNKRYDKHLVLEDINFTVYKGEFLSLLGPSGCGKTTLLRILIGIDKPDTGKVVKDGVDITTLKPSERNIGIVFQNYALFPTMSVKENISCALKARKLESAEIERRVNRMLEITELEEHKNKKPSSLSGGQKQRVALARTLVLEPDVILFDEPLSALDAEMKLVIRALLKDVQKKLGVTMIYVTHDQEEAFSMSDRVLVLHDHKIAQLDSPREIYHNPKNEFVKKFIVDHLNAKVKSIEDSIK